LLLIFDLDGTLIDSAPDLAESVNYTLRTLGKKEVSLENIRSFLGNGAEKLITRALSGGSDVWESEEVQRALRIFKDHYKNNVCNKTFLYEGVKETLEKLPYKKAIVTNKPYEFVGPILEKLDIKKHFDLWIGGESLKEKKPSPKPLLYVCERLGFLPQNAVMIGDSKNDILAGKNAGIKTVAVTYGYNYGEDVRKYKPDVVINRFEELLEVI